MFFVPPKEGIGIGEPWFLAMGSNCERRHAMKKLVTISNLLLVVLLFGVIGCKSSRRSCYSVRPTNQPSAAQAGGLGDMTGIALKPAPAPVSMVAPVDNVAQALEAVSTTVPAAPVVAADSGQYVVSQIYPCQACGSVQLDKIMPRQVELNKPLTYSMKVTNLTSKALSGVVVDEKLPESFELTSAVPTAKQNGKNLTWEIDSLGPNAVTEITVSGTGSKMESLEYCTRVTTPAATTCAKVEIIQPVLKLTKAAPQGVLLCEPIRVMYVLENTGTGAAKGVKIVDTLPEGLQTADGKNELVIDADQIPAGQVKEFSAELVALRPGKYVSKASANSAGGMQAESEAVTIIVDKPVLSVTMSGPDKQYVGREVTYKITVTNETDAPAKDTVIENAIPDGVTSMKATAGANLSDRKVAWPLGTLPPRASKTVQVSFAPTRKGVLSNSVSVGAYCADVVTASVKTTIKAIPAVLLEVIDLTDPVEVGTQTTYVITVTNQGSAPSTNIAIVCDLEENVGYVSSSGSTSGTIENGTLTFTPLNTLKPGAKAIWRVIVTALKEGDVRFKATMNASELGRSVEETEATRIYE
jgi:uncharacterized repeat protein (TIGR01451 family)